MTINGKKLFCLGFGYCANALARRLAPQGWTILGTTRSAEKASAMRAAGHDAVPVSNGKLPRETFKDVSAVLVSAPPGPEGCPALITAETSIRASARDIRWIGYLSTNGVYGDYAGAWVDETSALKATRPRGLKRIEAERRWREFGASINVPTIIFRLPGIYGPGRSAIETVRSGVAKRIYKEGQVFSRMHVDDIAAALAASIAINNPHDVYNLADDEPAPPQDVIEYACNLLGVEPLPLTPIEEAAMSEMALSFYADNKRVSNKRMKESLNFTLRYPTYREGLRAILQAVEQTS